MTTNTILTILTLLCGISSLLCALIVLSAIIRAAHCERSMPSPDLSHRRQHFPAHTGAAPSIHAAQQSGLAADSFGAGE